MTGPDTTRLTTVHGSFRAHVLAARLTDEGIDVELRGAVGAPYGVTMGDLARIDVYVPSEQVDDARYVMLVNDVEDALDADGHPPRRMAVRVIAGCVLAGLVVLPALRALGQLLG